MRELREAERFVLGLASCASELTSVIVRQRRDALPVITGRRRQCGDSYDGVVPTGFTGHGRDTVGFALLGYGMCRQRFPR